MGRPPPRPSRGPDPKRNQMQTGRPMDNGGRPNGGGRDEAGRRTCYECGSTGHMVADCRVRRRRPATNFTQKVMAAVGEDYAPDDDYYDDNYDSQEEEGEPQAAGECCPREDCFAHGEHFQ